MPPAGWVWHDHHHLRMRGRVLISLAASWSPPAARRAVRTAGFRAMAAGDQPPIAKPRGLPKGVEWEWADGAGNTHLRPSTSALPDFDRPFCVLGIETSCDDTGVAVVRSDGTILGEALASQAKLHEEYGGVMPAVARDAHSEALERVTAEALRRAGLQSAADVDAVAVTVG